MLLYRYFGSHALETLNKERLLTSRVSGFNDPFELLYSPKRDLTMDEAALVIQNRWADPMFRDRLKAVAPNVSEEQLREIVNQPHVLQAVVSNQPENAEFGLKERLRNSDETLRLICFSSEKATPLDEILLWSHYANKHQGHRIGFCIPDSPSNSYRISKVNYSPKRVEVDYSGNPDDPTFYSAMLESIITKSLAWKYEAEHRLIIVPSQCIPERIEDRIEHFFLFHHRWVVRVDCGLQSQAEADARIVDLVKMRYPHVSVYKAKFHSNDYSIVYDPIYAACE